MTSPKSIARRIPKKAFFGILKDKVTSEVKHKISSDPELFSTLSPESAQKLRSKSVGEWAIYKYTNKE